MVTATMSESLVGSNSYAVLILQAQEIMMPPALFDVDCTSTLSILDSNLAARGFEVQKLTMDNVTHELISLWYAMVMYIIKNKPILMYVLHVNKSSNQSSC